MNHKRSNAAQAFDPLIVVFDPLIVAQLLLRPPKLIVAFDPLIVAQLKLSNIVLRTVCD